MPLEPHNDKSSKTLVWSQIQPFEFEKDAHIQYWP